jgi:hypothetical protein
MGLETHVPAILKLRQMLLTDKDMGAVNPALHASPEAFNGVRTGTVEADIFLGAVIDRHMAMTALIEAEIGAQFVGMDCAAGRRQRAS